MPDVLTAWTSYTNANDVRALFVDRQGNLWSGGHGGLVQWDVQTGRYVKYTVEDGLASNDVTAIAQTQDGAMWIGTIGGLSRFDGKKWETYTAEDGLPDNLVADLAVAPDGKLWVDTRNNWGEDGIVFFDGNKWSSEIRRGEDVMTIAPNGVLWAGSYKRRSDHGVAFYDGKEWGYKNFEELEVTALAADASGTLWVGTKTALFRYDGNDQWARFAPWEGQTNAKISAIAFSPDNTLWVGFSHLYEPVDPSDPEVTKHFVEWGAYSYADNQWTHFTDKDGLGSNAVTSIVVGADGSVWFGSPGQGISRFDGKNWTVYKTEDKLLSNRVTEIKVSDQGVVWTGHPIGASRFDGSDWATYDPIGQLSSSFVFAIGIDPDQSVWIGTFGGVAHLVDGDWTTYRKEDDERLDTVGAIVSLPNGHHIFGTGKGALEFDGQKWESFSKLQDAIVFDIVLQPDGSLWFGTNFDNIYAYDGKVWKNYTEKNGLVEYFNSIVDEISLSPDGSTWVSTCEGLSHFDGAKWETVMRTKDLGLECISALAFDASGNVWAGSIGQLVWFDGQAWNRVSFPGLVESILYDMAFGPDGSLWIATQAGVLRYNPSR